MRSTPSVGSRERAPATRVVVFTAVTDDDALLDILRAGAAAIVDKAGGVDGMIHALHAVARGEIVIPRALTASLIERMRTVPTAPAACVPWKAR